MSAFISFSVWAEAPVTEIRRIIEANIDLFISILKIRTLKLSFFKIRIKFPANYADLH
jgi:hypothetical protein